eukprot:TRINITY_DN42919_c0_g1_i1.p1 TRINITY_DN42919_c0_g1~~TRINITY_DN42919_c0_g1_i1.p1  ORF type:complete len:1164 (+),score=609.58 TRINITY_DN42919_c0_g1_i1:94-3585(+)
MGKKGKVELKKKRQAFFAAKRKERKHERRERLKTRKPLSQDLQNIKDGITDMIQEQGAEPGSVAYFACLLSLLQARPDPKRLPYMLALMDYFMTDVSEGLLQRHCSQLMDVVIHSMKSYLADILIMKKGFAVLKTLFFLLTPTKAMFQKLQSMEPNKLHNQHMPLYLKTYTAALVAAHEKNEPLLHSLYQGFVTHTTQCFCEADEVVANSAARSFQVVFDHTIDNTLIQEKSATVLAVLKHVIGCIRDIQYRNNWDHLAECLACILGKIALTKSVLPIKDLFGEVLLTEAIPVLDKLRALDDFHFNSACDKALGASLRCVGVPDFLKAVPLNPLDLDPVSGRHHLLNVLRKNAGHGELGFFLRHFAPLITQCRKAEELALLHGKHLERKTLNAIHLQLWDLLPAFATFPSDLTEGGTYKAIAKELSTMFTNPDLARVACRTFVILIEKSRYLAEWQEEEDEESMEEEGSEGNSDEGDDADEDEEEEKMDEDVEKGKDDNEEESLDPLEQAEAQVHEILGTDFTNVPPETDPLTFHMISQEKATEYLQHIGSFSKNIIPVICNAIEKEAGEDRRVLLLSALRSYASVADKPVLNGVFKQVSKTLLQNTRREDDAKKLTPEATKRNRMMMEIGCVIAEYLDADALMILLSIIEPLLIDESDDYLLQKKTYRVLSRICRTRGDVVGGSIDRIVQLLAQSQEHCDGASRRERILCFIHTAVMHNDYDRHDELRQFVAGTVAEVMLSLKEASGRTRDASFQCLATYAELTKVNKFTNMILAGLAGTTPQLVSCTIITLSKILHEYHDVMDTKLKETLIKGCIAYIRHKSNEIKNAALSFTRLLLKIVTKSEEVRGMVERNLPELVHGCLSWTSQKLTPGNTRRNVQMIFERCIKRFGYDYMLSLFPDDHKKYLEYVERMRQREVKKGLKAKERRQQSKEQRNSKFNELFFQDSKREVMRMPGDAENFDLMDDDVVKTFVSSKQDTLLDRMRSDTSGKRDGMNVAMRGDKIMIQSEADYKRDLRHELLQKKMSQMDGTQRSALEDLSGGLLQKRKRRDDDDDVTAQDLAKAYDPEALRARQELADLQRSLKGPSKKERPKESKRARVESDVRTGSQFRAQTGSFGDVKKGAVDPFAYVPLNAKYLNKRHRMKAISRVGAVNETAKKGRK